MARPSRQLWLKSIAMVRATSRDMQNQACRLENGAEDPPVSTAVMWLKFTENQVCDAMAAW